MFNVFIDELKTQLRKPLPGRGFQDQMAPLERRLMKEFIPEGRVPKAGAVLVWFFPVKNVPYMVLMKRPDYEGTHSGQISLPGGKFEEKDIELRVTALRETAEETGADVAGVEVIGKLTDLYIPPSNFHVHPFIAYSSHRPAFSPDPNEVAGLFEISLEELCTDNIKSMRRHNRSLDKEVETPYYEIQQQVVWGATAMIISELREIIRAAGKR